MQSCAVVHVTSLLGGGVNRHLRDVARSSARSHLVWHVGDAAEVVEWQSRYRALDPVRIDADPESMREWLRSQAVGLVHVHSLHPVARKRALQVRRDLGAGCIATLHDVLFVSPDALDAGAQVRPDSAWLADNANFLRAADAVVAPSDYIADLARRHIEGLEVHVVPNGSTAMARTGGEPRARAEFAEHRPRHIAVVLGAIGPHKGSDILEALGEDLRGSGIAIVVIGYLDRQVVPGWRHAGTLFVHGAYSDDEVPGLIAAYGAEVALFPNRAPESFSYTLSDAWSCGLPALAAPEGALGERVSRHGGGWLLPAEFDAPAVAKRLREVFSESGAGELARVKSQLSRPDPGRVPSLEAMARSLDALYARFGIDVEDPAASSSAAIERLLAVSLDGSLFRPELARAADELAQALRANEELVATIESARAFEAGSREWIAKLERDIAALKAEVEREVGERRVLGEEVVRLRECREALELLPALVRRLLLKKIRDAGS